MHGRPITFKNMAMYIKKSLRYEERDESKRSIYLEELELTTSVNDRVHIDESDIDHNIIKEHCWIKKGAELVGDRSGKARGRTSVIAALHGEDINAPMTYQGTMNTTLFLCWIKVLLLPSLSKGQVVIMDNASIHKNIEVRELVESVGCRLIYLPPYSANFNPIENYWAVMKKNIRKIRDQYDNIRSN
ncbi:MAG: IS630 family transposase [Mariprofundaceae bacterium]|nr:IS630 family transposase [Mariprofundaceae bacterium]